MSDSLFFKSDSSEILNFEHLAGENYEIRHRFGHKKGGLGLLLTIIKISLEY